MSISDLEIYNFQELQRAVEALLAARENQMLTALEWDAIQHAVAECNQPPPANARDETFAINENVLTRAVRPARGARYEHTCDKDVFESVAQAIDELEGASFTYEEIRVKVQAPFTQVAVAVAFLRERGCIVAGQRRRSVAATEGLHLDAMIEWHALAEGSPGSA